MPFQNRSVKLCEDFTKVKKTAQVNIIRFFWSFTQDFRQEFLEYRLLICGNKGVIFENKKESAIRIE